MSGQWTGARGYGPKDKTEDDDAYDQASRKESFARGTNVRRIQAFTHLLSSASSQRYQAKGFPSRPIALSFWDQSRPKYPSRSSGKSKLRSRVWSAPRGRKVSRWNDVTVTCDSECIGCTGVYRNDVWGAVSWGLVYVEWDAPTGGAAAGLRGGLGLVLGTGGTK
jgi:hypothetical protein